ncbi:hypothetical protein RSP_0057 [Pseudomonas phage RSP]|nr:hypothetical protein RSP_0057 [Pseudomonas phage RSP]
MTEDESDYTSWKIHGWIEIPNPRYNWFFGLFGMPKHFHKKVVVSFRRFYKGQEITMGGIPMPDHGRSLEDVREADREGRNRAPFDDRLAFRIFGSAYVKNEDWDFSEILTEVIAEMEKLG